MQENILNGNHFATGFFSSKKNICFSVKISVFFVFHMNAALYLFHIDSFSCPPLPCCLPETLPRKQIQMRSHAKKHKKERERKS